MVIKLHSISSPTLRQMMSEAKAKIEIYNDTDFPTVCNDGSIAFNDGPTVFNVLLVISRDESALQLSYWHSQYIPSLLARTCMSVSKEESILIQHR